jgi:uncharacterized protein
MPVFYFETSALLKRYRREPGTEVVNLLLREKRDEDLFVTSHLTVLEISSVAARLMAGKVIRRSQYENLLAKFAQDLRNHDFVILPLTSSLVSEAIAVLNQRPLKSGDSIHVATALRAEKSVSSDSFLVVSSDREVLAACLKEKLLVLDPGAAGALAKVRSLL